MTDVLRLAAQRQYEAWIEDVQDLEPDGDDLLDSHKERLVGSLAKALASLNGVLELGWQARVYLEPTTPTDVDGE